MPCSMTRRRLRRDEGRRIEPARSSSLNCELTRSAISRSADSSVPEAVPWQQARRPTDSASGGNLERLRPVGLAESDRCGSTRADDSGDSDRRPTTSLQRRSCSRGRVGLSHRVDRRRVVWALSHQKPSLDRGRARSCRNSSSSTPGPARSTGSPTIRGECWSSSLSARAVRSAISTCRDWASSPSDTSRGTSTSWPINSNESDSIEDVADHARRSGAVFPVLKDIDNRVADQLLAERTCEALVIDGRGRLRYRGAIDDQYGLGSRRDSPVHHYLTDAIERCWPAGRSRPR